MKEIIALSQKELSRARILALVADGHVSLVEAAKSMKVSERQARRLLGRFKEAGAAGLAHGNRGLGRSSSCGDLTPSTTRDELSIKPSTGL